MIPKVIKDKAFRVHATVTVIDYRIVYLIAKIYEKCGLIFAINTLRACTGCDLKQGKYTVEAIDKDLGLVCDGRTQSLPFFFGSNSWAREVVTAVAGDKALAALDK